LGNTVVVVEHDEEIMMAADEIIDIGPAGRKKWWKRYLPRKTQ
jgi:excinuclease UvrABC ATPase subunit